MVKKFLIDILLGVQCCQQVSPHNGGIGNRHGYAGGKKRFRLIYSQFQSTMRFKKGSKVEVMNNVMYEGYQGVEKVSRRLISPSTPIKRSLKKVIQLPISGSKIFQDCQKVKKVNDVPRESKRASPFCSSIHEPSQKVKKVKADEKDGSQRYMSSRSYKKSYKIGGMHLLLPRFQTRFCFCCLSVGKSSGKFQHSFAIQIR
ncbi:hypothetical protein L2E82_05902 [Cichorium intybus]|uniref:Uncharacterized protein n=1 Tax=Cichorium intybus TaxID=13427 RepID=A0ACB9H9P0_CICIN|nr:hypothetical protein L2E82_05902 [Cichorium intybus]